MATTELPECRHAKRPKAKAEMAAVNTRAIIIQPPDWMSIPPRANRNLPTALSIARRILAGKTQETTWPGSTRKIGWRPNELLNAAGIETSHHNIPGISWQMQKSCSTSRRKECLARVPANTASRLLHSSVGNAGKFLVFPASISRILVSRDVWISGMAGIQIN